MRTDAKTIGREVVSGRTMAMALVLLALMVSTLVAQQAPTELALEEAISLAKSNNPTFLSTANDRSAANWQVREAYGAFLPSVTASGAASYTQAGVQRFGSVTLENQITDWYSSGYSVGLNWQLNGSTIFGVPNARANKRATDARIDAAEFNLESTVAFQYMAVLRGLDGVDVAQRQLDRARQNLEIVETRVSTGAAAGTEGRQAEVDLGRAEVALIQAQRALRNARLLLAEQLGVTLDENVRLSSAFDVFEPAFDVDRLVATALANHPSLNAFRAQESADRAAARQTATSQYLPTVNVNTSFRGNALQALNQDFILTQAENRAASRVSNCEFNNTLETGLNGGLPGYDLQDCSQYASTPEDREAAVAANDVFPFNFTTLPLTLTFSVQLPIFTGFSRQRQVSQANNAAEDAEHARRAEELRLRTAVVSTYDNLVSAYRVVQAEARNRALSEEQLELQRRRYTLGAAGVNQLTPILALMDAQTNLTTAEQSYLNAVYDFHYNLIALEAAVGEPLLAR